MASNDEYTFERNKALLEDHSNVRTSHKFEAFFSVLETLGMEQHKEELEYKTWCSYSNSWEIVIQFEKDIPFNNFNLLISLRRIDLGNHVVVGILVIWFLNIEGRKCPVPYHLTCVKAGGGYDYDVLPVDPHFNCLLREDHLTVPDDVLVVKVELFVKGCCNEKITDEPEIEKYSKKEGTSKVLCCPRL